MPHQHGVANVEDVLAALVTLYAASLGRAETSILDELPPMADSLGRSATMQQSRKAEGGLKKATVSATRSFSSAVSSKQTEKRNLAK